MSISSLVVVFPASAVKDRSGIWHSTGLTEADNATGAPGGILRVEAAGALYKQNPELIFVAPGGKGTDIKNDSPDRPLLSEMLKRELMQVGILEGAIVQERTSSTTYGILKNILPILGDNRDSRILLISNKYNMGRLKAIIENADDIKDEYSELSLEYKSAEEVLINCEQDKWEELISEFYNAEFMTGRLAKEEEGCRQILQGTYKFEI